MSSTPGDADKQDLREEGLQQRRTLTPPVIAAARAAVRAAVLAQQAREGWPSVAAYEPLRTEPGSLELLTELSAVGVRVLVPVTRPDRDLDWTLYGSTEPLGVAAIASVAAVIVPALAVAADGTRLGRGGGSYDRALARVPAGVPRVALLYDGELVAHLPRDPWDVPVTAVVTPSAGWRQLDGIQPG